MRASRVYEIKLNDRPEEVRTARVFFRDVAGELQLAEDQTESGELALSELVTNAIVHAGGPIAVRVWRDEDGLHLEVIDGDAQTPRMAKANAEGFDAGGLPIVAAVAREWGWDAGPNGDGKRVWLTLA